MKNADEIYRDMCAEYVSTTGYAVPEKSDLAVRMYAAAAQIESLYVYNDWVKKQCFPQTATGEYLDYHAQMRGITRKNASQAIGLITFSVPEPVEMEMTISSGTVCVTASGIRFSIIQSGHIHVGETSCVCSAKAVEPGEAGNVEANTVVYMTVAPLGVTGCVNEGAFSGGREKESDDSLRERILSTYKALPNGANAAYYEQKALSDPSVVAVKVLPKNRGVGTVDVIIAADYGIPHETLLDSVLGQLNYDREICVDIETLAPTAVNVSVSAAIAVESGYTYSDVSDKVEQAISDYFNGSLLGEDILRVKLGSIIYGVEGVKNYSLSLPASDVSIDSDELPILSTVTITALS